MNALKAPATSRVTEDSRLAHVVGRAIVGASGEPTIDKVASVLGRTEYEAFLIVRRLVSVIRQEIGERERPAEPPTAPPAPPATATASTPDDRLLMLTSRQREIYHFIVQRIRTKYAPTVREIGQQFGILSPNGVMCHLKALQKKGLIHRDSDTSRGMTLVASHDSSSCPACGRPLPPGTELSPTG
jgi:hypothetical protein